MAPKLGLVEVLEASSNLLETLKLNYSTLLNEFIIRSDAFKVNFMAHHEQKELIRSLNKEIDVKLRQLLNQYLAETSEEKWSIIKYAVDSLAEKDMQMKIMEVKFARKDEEMNVELESILGQKRQLEDLDIRIAEEEERLLQNELYLFRI